jgi:hypothetical protein
MKVSWSKKAAKSEQVGLLYQSDIIRIAAVWDTRREPKSQANQLK